MAFPTGWGRKQKITIQSSQVSGSGSHTDFPFLVTLDHLNAEIVEEVSTKIKTRTEWGSGFLSLMRNA